jgi:hypothetical protein
MRLRTVIITTTVAVSLFAPTAASAQTGTGDPTTSDPATSDTTTSGPGTTIEVPDVSGTTSVPGVGLSPTVTTGGSTSGRGEDLFADVRAQYTTLSAALVAGHSATSGRSLGDLLATNGASWDESFGAPGLFAAMSFDDLNAKLAGYTVGGTPTADGITMSSWDAMVAKLTNSAGTPDGQLIAASIDFGRQVGNLPQPQLTMPSLGAVSSIATANGDEMMFGLFANQTVAQMLRTAPDVIGQINAGGKLSPAAQQQFNQSMLAAGKAVNTSLGNALPSPCYAAMVAAMSTGNPAAASGIGAPQSCTPCITAGAYMHGRMSELVNPQSFITNGVKDGKISSYEWTRLDQNTRNALLATNPDLARQIQSIEAKGAADSRTLNANTTACTSSATGATNFLGSNLGSVLSRIAP